MQLVRFVIADHLPPTPGRPLRVLPFARSVEDSCYFALDLARPAGSDFPVLFIPHDSVVDPAVED